jgi:type VI secretion system protein ImpH
MGTDIRKNSSLITDDLVENGPSYNVWQAVRIADRFVKKLNPQRDDSLFEQTGLKFRPFEKYEYPPSDIKKISYEEGVFNFVLTFLGLYGINSPIPRCYHEQVDFQQRILGPGQVPLQNFLDIFNNRFYWLYYQSWKKYRFYLHLHSEENNKIIQRINSFSGRGFFTRTKSAALSDYTLLKFSGLFSQRVRNKSGLKILLRYLFPHFKMEIKEFIPTWIELKDVPTLGSNENVLGETSFIGEHTLDCTSRICIDIGPISFHDYLDFLPGNTHSNKLRELLDLYLNDGLEYDFNFIIKSDTIVTISWDDDRLRLGSTLWLGKPEQDIVDVYMPYEQLSVQVN